MDKYSTYPYNLLNIMDGFKQSQNWIDIRMDSKFYIHLFSTPNHKLNPDHYYLKGLSITIRISLFKLKSHSGFGFVCVQGTPSLSDV